MIINFERTPEEFFRLSRAAFDAGDLPQALFYGEKALSGKGSTEYKVSLAEIFLSMERYSDAIDLALDALCHGRGFRSEVYDLLIRALNESGHVYESIYYIARKAKYEGDEESLDAMDEMMEDFVSEVTDKKEQSDLFVIGEEKKKESGVILAQASMCLHRQEYDEAIALLKQVDPKADYFREAQSLLLKAYSRAGREEDAARTAQEIVSDDPQSAYALYYLITKLNKTEYLPDLAKVRDDKQDLYFAVAAADQAGEYSLSADLAKRLVAREPYLPESYFVAAATLLNGGEKAKSADYLKRLFSLYSKYPASLILKGWARLKKCEPVFDGGLPEEVVKILRRHVRKGAKDSECFVKSMLTDASFRAATLLLLEEGDREVAENVIYFLGVENNKQVDLFFSKLLLRTRIDPMLKRAILAQLLFHKEKGRLWVSPSGVPIRVSCEKPAHYVAYPENLKIAYLNLYSFLLCLNETACAARVTAFSEVLYPYTRIERVREQVLGAAMLYRLLSEGEMISLTGGMRAESGCVMLMEDIFGARDLSMEEVKSWADRLTD